MAHYETNINIDINDFIHTNCQIDGSSYSVQIATEPIRDNKANGLNDTVDIKVDANKNDIFENLEIKLADSHDIKENLDIDIDIEEDD